MQPFHKHEARTVPAQQDGRLLTCLENVLGQRLHLLRIECRSTLDGHVDIVDSEILTFQQHMLTRLRPLCLRCRHNSASFIDLQTVGLTLTAVAARMLSLTRRAATNEPAEREALAL